MIEKSRNLLRRMRKRARPDATARIYPAAIMHLDIVGSTRLVRQDLELAHRQVRQLYLRLCRICASYGGIARELRGDAAVVEFDCATQALRAALAIQRGHSMLNRTRIGKLSPDIRTGLSYGPIISEHNMITGEAVIRAQRLEQLAEAGQVLFDQTVAARLEADSTIEITRLGARQLKGFDERAIVYHAAFRRLRAGAHGVVGPGFLLEGASFCPSGVNPGSG